MKKLETYRNIGIGVIALCIIGLFLSPETLGVKVSAFLIGMLILLLLVIGAVAFFVWLAASKAKDLFQTVARTAATEGQKGKIIDGQRVKQTEPTKPIEVQPVTNTSSQTPVKAPRDRSMRCKSCGAVSRLTVDQPDICLYCDSPLSVIETDIKPL